MLWARRYAVGAALHDGRDVMRWAWRFAMGVALWGGRGTSVVTSDPLLFLVGEAWRQALWIVRGVAGMSRQLVYLNPDDINVFSGHCASFTVCQIWE